MAPTATAPRFLTRDEILARGKNRPTEVVEVWGGAVPVTAMSGAERDEYEAFMVRFNSSGGVAGINVEGKRAKLVSIVVKNADGSRMFKGPADVLALGDLDADGLDRLIKVAMRLSGIGEEELAAAKETFTDGQNGSSGTDSPAISA
jgi:hypothetical protein